ncbi:hypothetical protein DVH05_005653 [Phytophthora capsici]|nr:hypothetical protein DVH05_005653 [Phytophthora capsici]
MEVFRSLGKYCGETIGKVARAVRPVDTIRHPLPMQKRVKNKAMLVICGLRAGLVASMTLNPSIPDELLHRHEAATYVDAVLIANTRNIGTAAGNWRTRSTWMSVEW